MSSSDESDSGPEIESLNISNDQYYKPLNGFTPRLPAIIEEYDVPKYGSRTIRHALPAYDLWTPFFPTWPNEDKLRNFHRPKLRHYKNGPQSRLRQLNSKPFPIKSLSRTIFRYQKKLRFRVIQAINSGMARDEIINKFLLIHKAEDLTARRGELILFEYCEEHPPILPQIGMASNIKTYAQPSTNHLRPIYKNQITASETATSQKSNPNTDINLASNLNSVKAKESILETNQQSRNSGYKIGIDTNLNPKSKPIYFNHTKIGLKQQVIENNMFRAPIFQHQVPSCDFLVIRTRNSFYIRSVKIIFTVGQTMPLIVIPKPTEAAISRFKLELSNFFINKLFMGSGPEPTATVNFDIIAKHFPYYQRRTLQDRLTRNGAERLVESLYRRGSSRFGLSTLQELRASFPPERYCAYASMLVARQRLRELNYTDSMINPSNEAETEIEVLAAPWNTSKAVVDTLASRCYLDLSKHLIDPTGIQREGFSCVSWLKSPTEDQQIKERSSASRSVTPPEKLSAIPTKNPLAQKIIREKLERLEVYKREASHIAEVQSNILNSKEILSSDEDDAEEVDDDNQFDNSFDQQLQDLDKLVVGGRTQQELTFEKEEDERIKMLQEFRQESSITVPPENSDSALGEKATQINVGAFKNKIMKIIRTYRSDEGPIQRTEIVRDPKIIALYMKKRGGSMNGCSVGGDQRNLANHKGGNPSILTNTTDPSQNRVKSRLSLGPSELCRADGIVLTISKKVLNTRKMRKDRRESMKNDSN